MADNATIKIFPSSEEEAVAMLYVQRQGLTGKSPSEIYTMYQEAYYEILMDLRKKRNAGWFRDKDEEIRQF